MPFSKIVLLIFFSFIVLDFSAYGQIAYQNVYNKNASLGSYGRIGVDWSYENGGSIGRRLNLNNMGSIGGRMEEQDYLELAPALHFRPKEGDSTQILAQMRFSVYSNSLTSFGNSSTSSLGGLTLAMPEMFVEARNINGKDLTLWVGARLYRGPDVHIADHFYFNDHSSQGFGVEYKKTRFSTHFIAKTDTTSTLPPYFYLNIKTGTPSAALRQRTVLVLEHDLELSEDHTITGLAEYHYMGQGGEEEATDTLDYALNFGADRGFVLGARHQMNLKGLKEGSFNHLAVRYGMGIANGGDGGISQTWATFGAPDTTSLSFKGAYSLSIVNHAVLNLSDFYTFNGYIIYTQSKGAAPGKGLSPTYFGKEVYNYKQDFTIGSRNEFYFTDYFHLLGELHYSQRQDGDNPVASTVKFTVAPIFVPTGQRDTWARPHLRFVASLARYNDYAMETLYSPYLQFVGAERWGHYLGVKAEWWIF